MLQAAGDYFMPTYSKRVLQEHKGQGKHTMSKLLWGKLLFGILNGPLMCGRNYTVNWLCVALDFQVSSDLSDSCHPCLISLSVTAGKGKEKKKVLDLEVMFPYLLLCQRDKALSSHLCVCCALIVCPHLLHNQQSLSFWFEKHSSQALERYAPRHSA